MTSLTFYEICVHRIEWGDVEGVVNKGTSRVILCTHVLTIFEVPKPQKITSTQPHRHQTQLVKVRVRSYKPPRPHVDRRVCLLYLYAFR